MEEKKKNKRTVLKLEKKVEIAKILCKKSIGYKKIAKQFSITEHQAREISKNKFFLSIIDTNNKNNLNKKYLCQKTIQKNAESDAHIPKMQNSKEKNAKTTFSLYKS